MSSPSTPLHAFDDVAQALRAALLDPSSSLWFPELTSRLAGTEWDRLNREIGLTRASYGTARMWRRNPTGEREIVAWASPPVGADGRSIQIEDLAEEFRRVGEGKQCRFYGRHQITAGGLKDQVDDALRVLAKVRGVVPTICALVRSLHLLHTDDDEIDVSFSYPDLPFSVFVSIPGPKARHSSLRVAESLLHEALHLQLTLIERLLPLVEPSEQTYYSPWRGEYRNARGVFHALYVFRSIETFFRTLEIAKPQSVGWRQYQEVRRAAILRQIEKAKGFAACECLTLEGKAFAARLLA